MLLGIVTARLAASQPQNVESASTAPLRAMLWLQPGTEELLDRIRGQTNDLQVQLAVDTLDPMPGELGAQLRVAYTLSQQQDVSLVIWFVRQADPERHFIVNIAIPTTQRLLTRDLGPSDAGSGSVELASAVKESAALVVRAAIQAVRSGMTIGEVHAARFDDVTAPQASGPPQLTVAPSATTAGHWRDTTEVPRPAAEAPVTGASSRDWPWAIGGEWLAVYDGPNGSPIAECASLRAERRVQSVKAFVSGGGCLSRHIDNTHGAFRIGRQQAALGASMILWRRGIEASLGAQAGAVLYERNTLLPQGPGVYAVGSPTTHVLGRMGPEFRLLVPAHGSRLQAGLVLGVDFLTNPLKIGYRVYNGTQGSSSFDQAAQTSVVQPYLALGLAIRL